MVTITYTLREATAADELLLWEMLTVAAHVGGDPAAAVADARTHPFLAKFVRGWGRAGDLGVVVEVGAEPIGAVWVRHLTGDEQSYPAVDPAYPELAIGVRQGWEGRGLGGALLGRLVVLVRPTYPGIVLSVREENPARRLYERHGFQVSAETVNRVGTRSYVMVLRLRP